MLAVVLAACSTGDMGIRGSALPMAIAMVVIGSGIIGLVAFGPFGLAG